MRVGLIGCGGRGPSVAKVFAARSDVEVAYLADVDQRRLAAAARNFPGAKTTADFRTMLADPAVVAVINATPVHWHTPATILACDAGKHVYVEKPCSHNLAEGRWAVEAARRNKRVVQHGTQVRSTTTIREGVRLLREGIIGEVMVARAWNIQRRPGAGGGAPAEPPTELDYDGWIGPAPMVPFRERLISDLELAPPLRHRRDWK